MFVGLSRTATQQPSNQLTGVPRAATALARPAAPAANFPIHAEAPSFAVDERSRYPVGIPAVPCATCIDDKLDKTIIDFVYDVVGDEMNDVIDAMNTMVSARLQTLENRTTEISNTHAKMEAKLTQIEADIKGINTQLAAIMTIKKPTTSGSARVQTPRKRKTIYSK